MLLSRKPQGLIQSIPRCRRRGRDRCPGGRRGRCGRRREGWLRDVGGRRLRRGCRCRLGRRRRGRLGRRRESWPKDVGGRRSRSLSRVRCRCGRARRWGYYGRRRCARRCSRGRQGRRCGGGGRRRRRRGAGEGRKDKDKEEQREWLGHGEPPSGSWSRSLCHKRTRVPKTQARKGARRVPFSNYYSGG